MADVLLKVNKPDDPAEVVAAFKKEGISNLDELVKKGLELYKQQPKGGSWVLYSGGGHVFFWISK